ncbi:ATP-binding cassette domain-containing protein [Gordonia neofelifaecis]|uniref:Oligopeptide/dipeptide ABC transporter, ATPase subunit n=1 Tax=Gordonia neofelifaecis NRRL B-59395 TaxID=644548 RepID=F1YMD4_9ACTN|nr:ATP-binding cassette domain-containing protein [Gordonia neofelifaecis]EGD54183.1 oligopeptide/dipeptide ABC transporter, ATPase subunit [Gordonia neofelifaecis NRRL B-59395]
MTSALLEIEDLRIEYRKPGLLRRKEPFVAVDGVSLRLERGQTLGLVGESGSGKTTLARSVLCLVDPTAGRIEFDGTDVTGFRRAGIGGTTRRVPHWYRRRVQAIFQDPTASLNPSWSVRDIVAEPLRVHTDLRDDAVTRKVATLLDQVGLDPSLDHQRPAAFSGGQRQRIGIARALATEPDLIVCDEPVSALDVSTQSTIVNLLNQVQRDTGVAYLFIGHDLGLMRHMSDRLAVMYHGRLVEEGPAEDVYHRPADDYTRRLLDAAPGFDPAEQRRKRELRRPVAAG